MDHGTPVDPGTGGEHCGGAGPFILDVGICSTREALRFFGLLGAPSPAVDAGSAPDASASSSSSAATPASSAAAAASSSTHASSMAGSSSSSTGTSSSAVVNPFCACTTAGARTLPVSLLLLVAFLRRHAR
jgi:hypothetical protein